MNRIRVVALALTALATLAACDDSYPGGSRAGDGGAGGTEDVAVRPVALPGLEVPVRSQLFAPVYGDDGLLPAGYVVYLLDQPRACASPDGLRLDDGEGWIRLSFGAPALGDCTVHGGQVNQPAPDEERAPPAGCTASVDAGRGGTTLTEARGGTVRIDRLAADVLAGELRLSLPATPVATLGCNLSWSNVGHGWELDDANCVCEGASGQFECRSTDENDQDCCDDGVPLVEVIVPFEATRCPDAGRCWAQPCAPYLVVDSCRPEAAAPASCEAACEAYVSVCRDCTGCDAVSCEAFGRCEPDACLDRCRALGGADPLVDLSLACLEAATTCDDWISCVSSCGA